MDAEEMNQALYELYDKMAAEQGQYRNWLLTQSPEKILNHTYEYTVREDILIAMETVELDPAQVEALMSSPSPLSDVYKDFSNIGTDYIDILHGCIENRAEDILEARREKTRAIPLYKESSMYAEKHGEIDVFRASLKTNIACRDSIEALIRVGHDGLIPYGAAKLVLAEFGAERVSHVLAATLQDNQHDGRFSRSNIAWAQSVPMFNTGKRHCDYAIFSRPVVLNAFVMLVRDELDAMQKRAEQKPSIKAQLAAAKEAQAEKSAAQQHQKDRGAR